MVRTEWHVRTTTLTALRWSMCFVMHRVDLLTPIPKHRDWSTLSMASHKEGCNLRLFPNRFTFRDRKGGREDDWTKR